MIEDRGDRPGERPGEPVGDGPDDDRDDDALSWAGEGEDPTLAAGDGSARVKPSALVEADDDEADDEADATSAAEAAAASSVLLVATGVTAGIYLLYTIAWMITATRQTETIAASFAGDALGGGLYGLGLWLAVAAPAVWFAAVLLGTRDARVRTRVLWLVAGLLLLAPLPFLRGA